MDTPTSSERLRHAKLCGAASGIRGQLWTDTQPERLTRHRAEWPELWERIDRLVELVDWD